MGEHSLAEEGTFQKVNLPSPSSENPSEANVVFVNGNPVFMAKPLTVVRAATSTGGARVLAPPLMQDISQPPFDESEPQMVKVKEEPDSEVVMETQMEEPERQRSEPKEPKTLSFDDFLKSTNTKVMSEEEGLKSMLPVEAEAVTLTPECNEPQEQKTTSLEEKCVKSPVPVEEEVATSEPKEPETASLPEDSLESTAAQASNAVCSEKVESSKRDEEVEVLKVNPFAGLNLKRPSKAAEMKKEKVEEKIPNVEDGEFPQEPGWYLLGRKVEIAISTARGVRRLVDNEIVHFNFPIQTSSSYKSAQWIVRISTKRSGLVIF